MDVNNFKAQYKYSDVNSKQKEYIDQYKFLTSEDSIDFTKETIMTLGKALESLFPGLGFMIIGRVKAEDSYKGKVNTITSNKSRENKKIYDTIGIRLVVEKIPDSITDYMDKKNDYEEIAYINKYQTFISDANNRLNTQILKINKQIKSFGENEEFVQILKEHKANIIELYDENIKIYSDEIKRKFSQYSLKKVLNSDLIKKEQKISRIPGRNKIKLGGKTGYYYAAHDCITARIPSGDWVAEIQALTVEDYTDSIEGPGAHEMCKGKDRRFPQVREIEEQPDKFKESVLKSTPQMMIYSDGQLVVCSEMANVTHHYLNIFQKYPQLLEIIQAEDGLFSDKSEIIVKDDNEPSYGEL